MKKILIATTNPGKFNEIKYFLKDLPIKLLSLSDFKISGEPKEDGKTFKENAIKKAKFYFEKTKIPTIADDGGIEIDYLNGEPGIKSKRWIGGKVSSDQELIKYTLLKMSGLPQSQRGARFIVVVSLIDEKGKIRTSTGSLKGIISDKPYEKVTKGYPYRALFYLPKIKKYYNEFDLTKVEFEKVSHRGKALQKIKKIIQSEL